MPPIIITHPDIHRLRINVFLSSTYLDLKKHREQIHLALDRLKWPQVHWMEGEPGQEGKILERCLEMIEDSQIHVGLIGSRYGTIIEDDRGCLSITEREFDYATRLGLYRIVFISQTRKTKSNDEVALESFKSKVQEEIWPDYFKNEYDLASKVSIALSDIWNELNGRMFVTVFRPWGDFARSVKPQVDLRACIAQDSGIQPHKVWLTSPEAPIPEVTKFVVLLPNFYKNCYLSLGPERWTGQVIHASNYDPDSPSFSSPELIDFYKILNQLVKESSNESERYMAIKEWTSRWRRY